MRINHSLILVGGFCPVMVESSKPYSKDDWKVGAGTALASEYSEMFSKIKQKIGKNPEVARRIDRLRKAMEEFDAKDQERQLNATPKEIKAFLKFAAALREYVSEKLDNEHVGEGSFITVAKFNALSFLAREIEIVGRRWTSWLKFDKFIKNCEAGIKILDAMDKKGVLAAKKGFTNPTDDSGKDDSTLSAPIDAQYKHDSEYYPYFLIIKEKIGMNSKALPRVEKLYRAMEIFDENSQGGLLEATVGEKEKFEEFAEALKGYAKFDNNGQPTGEMKDENNFLVARKFNALTFLASEIEIVVGGSTSWFDDGNNFIHNCIVGINILNAKDKTQVVEARDKFRRTSSSKSTKKFEDKIKKSNRL